MEIVDEMNERFELCPIERSGANTIIDETFKKEEGRNTVRKFVLR